MPYEKSNKEIQNKRAGFKMKGFSGFTPPQEKEKDVMIDKGGPISPAREGMTYEHKYDEDGKLLSGYPKWVPKRKKK